MASDPRNSNRKLCFQKKCTGEAPRCILVQLPPLAEIASCVCGPCWCVLLTKIICHAPEPTGGALELQKGNIGRYLGGLARLIARVAHNGDGQRAALKTSASARGAAAPRPRALHALACLGIKVGTLGHCMPFFGGAGARYTLTSVLFRLGGP